MNYPNDFLLKLFERKEREVFARITALNFQEEPLEYIEGRVTQGSINIDGSSAVRRTCSVTLVAQELNLVDYHWGIKSKFKLEVGLKNNIDSNYPDIIWFPQGIYVINSFNTSHNTNSYSISINGKDKMCMLNGELGGSLTASIDFSKMEDTTIVKDEVTEIDLPIETIIREAVHTWGGEDYHNIIINDLKEQALELLSYNGEEPLYLFYSNARGVYINYTTNGAMQCYLEGQDDSIDVSKLEDYKGRYDPRVDVNMQGENIGTNIWFVESDKQTDGNSYKVAKVSYGETVGYRPTELTYAGDLISNVGESLTSVLDKIVKMLGNYEYFYDLDGRFIFQKQKAYTNQSWNTLVQSEEGVYAEAANYSSNIAYNFNNNELFTSFSNSPTLTELKNDYSIWGKRKTINDVDVPIHYRFAIDFKPEKYVTFEGKSYTAEDFDWRELIYQMAVDYYKHNQENDFLIKLAELNPQYPTGKTGYEQYYTDMLGFWRQLYSDSPETDFEYSRVGEQLNTITANESFVVNNIDDLIDYDPKDVYVGTWFTLLDKELYDITYFGDMYVLWQPLDTEGKPIKNVDFGEDYKLMTPIIDAYITGYEASFKNGETSSVYYIPSFGQMFEPVPISKKNFVNKEELYIKDGDEYVSILDVLCREYSGQIYIKDYTPKNPVSLDSLGITKHLYYNSWKYNELDNNRELKCFGNLYYYKTNMEGLVPEYLEDIPVTTPIDYYIKKYNYIVENDLDKDEEGNIKPEEAYKVGWNKMIFKEPETINFWFDFMDANSELGQYAVSLVGDRTKVVNDDNIKAIYFRAVPDLLFTDSRENLSEDYSGYIQVYANANLDGLFNISGQGKSAKDTLDELLYQNSYCVENVTINAVPLYHLEPNTRIYVKDEKSNVDGEYIMTKLTISLTYNGTMSITATKAPPRLY